MIRVVVMGFGRNTTAAGRHGVGDGCYASVVALVNAAVSGQPGVVQRTYICLSMCA